MKFLHTSDWHLGISLHHVPLLAEQRHFAVQLTELIRRESVDAVVVAGDIFDSSVSTGEAIGLYNQIATEICKNLRVPMVVIAGNHDGAARLSSMRELLADSGLYVTGKLTRDIRPIIIKDAAFYCIPHFNLDEARALYPEDELKTYEQAMNRVCDAIREHMDPHCSSVAVAHAFVSGAALSDSDRSAIIGSASMVSRDVFHGFAYTALGHLHRPQTVGKNIRYSGSPIKYSFSEAEISKSVTIYDTQTNIMETKDLYPIHNMRQLSGCFEELVQGDPSEDYMKLCITDRSAGPGALETFRAMYPNLLSISGRQQSTDLDAVTLTIAETRNLSPAAMVEKFFQETFDTIPDSHQVALFVSAMEEAVQEGGVS